jgi:rfaE bifunctional protein nucleotidyltransferase chain/domain
MSYHKKLNEKLVTKERLTKLINFWRFKNKKIVFTNGCFDILHPGHVDYLSRARDLGNILILGLNTDASVKRQNKADNRPINNEQARAIVLAGLESVDAVILFDEDTPHELIKFVQPDVLVKGADYKAEEIVGFDTVTAKGGQVMTIPLLEGFSTTMLIEKLKK